MRFVIKNIKFRAIIIMVCILVSGCGSNKMTANDYEGPMLDHVLNGINDKNYDEFSKDFSDTEKKKITSKKFNSLVALLNAKIGDFESKSFSRATTKKTKNMTLTIVVYKTKYSKESGNVLIILSISNQDGKRRIEGLNFNSPNLRK